MNGDDSVLFEKALSCLLPSSARPFIEFAQRNRVNRELKLKREPGN